MLNNAMTVSQGEYATSNNNESLPPPAAIFSIPTHATTHASIPLTDHVDEGYDEQITLQGRPMPRRETSGEAYNEVASGAFLTQHPPRTPPAILVDPPLSHPASGPWRTAHTILTKDISAIQIDDPSTVPNPRSLPPPGVPMPAMPFAAEPAQQERPPPKYRRNKHVSPPNALDAARQEITGQPAQGGQGGRFPRWRGWLEKRAMERHDEQAEATATSATQTADGDVQRKKSWGAAIDDDDAVSESEDTEQDVPIRLDSPLHVHNFGSRFIPHLSSLPLCAVTMELPPANVWSTARLLRRQVPEGSKRRILLVGTTDGLYAVELQREKRGEESTWTDSLQRKARGDPRTRQDERGSWNGNIRTCQVMSGIGIYQMSLLSTSQSPETDARPSLYGFASRPAPPQDTGILLALCSTKVDASKHHPPPFGTGQANLHADANPTSGTVSSLSNHGHREVTPPSLSTAHVGVGGGGGQGKPRPASGTGDVRMWSIEAIRRIVAHVLDSADHQPLDMLRASRDGKRGIGKTNFASRLRKAWASLGEPSTERKTNRASREFSSESASAEALAMRYSISAEGARPNDVPRSAHVRSQSEHLLSGQALYHADGNTTPTEEPVLDASHQECLRLAHAWVPITLPGAHPYSPGGAGHSDSVSSLYSEETHGMSGAGSSTLQGHGHPSTAHPGSSGKGIAFYALIEAGPEVQGAGTWYLALAQSRSILLYESVKPISRGDARSWAFVKEFYTPVAPKGMTFCFSESPDPDEVSRASISSAATGSSTKRQLVAHRSVKSSAYSSVFRAHPSLNLFVSMGKRAVMIRASDGNVKEVEFLPATGRTGDNEMLSPSSDTGHYSTSKSSLGHGHSRRVSEVPENAATKDHWVGLERVTARVIIRCKPAAADEATGGTTERDEEEEEEEDWDSDEAVTPGERGVTLRDTAGQSGVTSLLRRPRKRDIPAYTIFAGLAVLTKGSHSHIIPSPLPRDIYQSRPLEALQWSGVPTSVSASARVIGLERDLSSGPVSINVLGRSKERRASTVPGESHRSNTVILHVVIALLACLPSRLEMKRVRVRLPVRTPFYFRRDSELELEPASVPASAAMQGLASSYGADDETSNQGSAEAHQEWEYLCGMLQPTHFDQTALKPWEAAGDGGAWAFDWRGADDYRLFYAGVQV